MRISTNGEDGFSHIHDWRPAAMFHNLNYRKKFPVFIDEAATEIRVDVDIMGERITLTKNIKVFHLLISVDLHWELQAACSFSFLSQKN